AAFCKALEEVCASLAEQVVADGEGATRIAEIKVEKAKNEKEALAVARAISGSLLVKTALNGCDPNWGRIICAAGYSGVPVDENKMELFFGKYPAFIKGAPAKTPEKKLAAEMKKEKVEITLVLNRGRASASCLFCDISKDYVTINADYRS
ncbi:MAG: bifunctional ornithine acetyltransferase/N-acetylglutamate synthase, partial [Nitrospinota bacterium]